MISVRQRKVQELVCYQQGNFYSRHVSIWAASSNHSQCIWYRQEKQKLKSYGKQRRRISHAFTAPSSGTLLISPTFMYILRLCYSSCHNFPISREKLRTGKPNEIQLSNMARIKLEKDFLTCFCWRKSFLLKSGMAKKTKKNKPTSDLSLNIANVNQSQLKSIYFTKWSHTHVHNKCSG